MSRVDNIASSQPAPTPGPYIARVVSHMDPTYMGGLEVELMRPVGNTHSAGQLHQVRYMSPFYGVTSVDFVGKDNDFNNTQKSYGMWMIPPDPGTQVVVIFIDGDPKRGYWIGCVQDENMNFMIPGLASTTYLVGGKNNVKKPVAEYNKVANNSSGDSTQIKKPAHPFALVLENQGLLSDDIRGTTTSSARRETPSSVFGISTPGPLDKSKDSKKGKIGKAEHAVNMPVSRLGGTTFVMDDGDDKFLRKKPASEAPPEYAAKEKGEKEGDVNIPHNELFRVRTRTGHQILLHNSEDLIYIGNARGTAWIEFTSNGKIDIYSKDSISIFSENDLNFSAKRDINFTSHSGSINMNAFTNINASAEKNIEIRAGVDGKITAVKNLNFNSEHHIETAGTIDMNGPTAATASAAPIGVRAPMPEPWWGHENLNPTLVTIDKTVAIAPSASKKREDIIKQIVTEPTDNSKRPTYKAATVVDTFIKDKGSK